ncbi:hypothetical protein V1511DRAFT_527880 [Dipodascopsis uninucleata]
MRCHMVLIHTRNSNLPPTIRDVFDAFKGEKIKSGDTVTVHGWLRSIRKQKKVAFANITDGTSDQLLQLIFDDISVVESLSIGASIRATGKLQEINGKSPEIVVSTVRVLGEVTLEDPYPLQKKFQTQEYLRREHPSIRFRTMANATTMRLRSSTAQAISTFFHSAGFTQTHPPLITSSDCEGAGEVFAIAPQSDYQKGTGNNFFGKKAYLTVSTQLHLEALMMGLTRVWTLTPAFRAEASVTSRHLSEFWMLEAEVGFSDDIEQIMSLVESMICSVVSQLKEQGVLESIVRLRNMVENSRSKQGSSETESEDSISADTVVTRWNALTKSSEKWPRITYTDAIEILQNAVASKQVEFEHPIRYQDGLATEHEKWLAAEYATGPIFITRYPAELKPFYMLPTPGASTVECFDLLVPELGELVGGSMREHDPAKLRDAILGSGSKMEDLEWYVNIRRWGTVPHGGFGLGFERLLCYLGGVYNIREAIAFPRWVDHCTC